MPASSFFTTFFYYGVYALRIAQPLFALFIVYQCFSSMRKHRRNEQPLIMLDNLLTRRQIPVMYWENSIGRSKTSDIILADSTVSRDHAVLYRRDEGWLIADTASKSGVLVNNKKINEPTTVHINDVISVGTTPLMIRRADRPNAQKVSWFFDRGGNSVSSSSLLFMVSLFHLFLCLQLCFTDGKFTYLPLVPYGVFTACGWIFFFFTTKVFKRVSFELETLAFFLSGTGVLVIAGEDLQQTYTQIAAMFIGMGLFCFILWFIENPDRVMKWRLAISILAVCLLAFNMVFGREQNGAQNWIIIGPFSLQPSEFVKIALVFVGTSALTTLQTGKNMTEFIVFSAICIGALFYMSDYGTACIFFFTFLTIAFIRSGDIRTIIFICAAALLGAFVILQMKPYVAERFEAWGHVWEYVDTKGYQQAHVLTYAASGGLFGMGLGNGNLKYIFASTSDLAFGMLCEELGVFFAILVAMTIAGLALYACTASSTSRSTLYSIASCSAAGMLVFQSCLNIFGATDILPLTGVTLPFISMGGSSMMAVWGLLAFIKASDERTYAATKRRSAQ